MELRVGVGEIAMIALGAALALLLVAPSAASAASPKKGQRYAGRTSASVRGGEPAVSPSVVMDGHARSVGEYSVPR
jgi:hypothetical protein